ncbi:MAG: CHASE domain-containing protein [Verrucomicrobiota bacterium]
MSDSLNNPPAARTRSWVLPVIALALLVWGLWESRRAGWLVDRDQRLRLLGQATAVARSLDVDRLNGLSFTEGDGGSSEFRALDSQLAAYVAQLPGVRGIYTMRLREGQVYFGPESYPAADAQASPPGTVYQKPPAALSGVFGSGQPATVGPYRDEYGMFVTALAPVLDPRTGEVRVVVGVDMEAPHWSEPVVRARAVPLLFTLLLLGMVLLTGVALARRRGRAAEDRWRLRHVETAAVAAVGLVISGAMAWRAHDAERRAQRALFVGEARAQAGAVAETLHDIRTRLEMLSGLFALEDRPDRAKFHAFAEPLTRDGIAQAWEWVPAVRAAELEELERLARLEGLEEFRVYERGPAGRRTAVSGRDFYYPVLFAEPEKENRSAIGFDVGSEAVRRAALLSAAGGGRPSCSDAVTLVQETGHQRGLLGFWPVFHSRGSSAELRGFTVVVLRSDSLLEHSIRQTGAAEGLIRMTLQQLEPGRAPGELGVAPAAGGAGPVGDGGEYEEIVPVFFFEKPLALRARAARGFFDAHPLRRGWVAGGMGLLVTSVLTGLTWVLVNRRTTLEREIRARTLELEKDSARLKMLWQALEQSPASVVITDLQGKIEYVNQKFTEATGYSREEVIGKNPRVLKSGRQPVGFYEDMWKTLSAGENWRGEFCNRRRDGGEYWESALISPVKDAQGRVLKYLAVKEDITERKRSAEALERTNRQLELTTLRANEMAVRAELASAAKSQFLANMSHEIRTPMNGIIGMTNLLLDTGLTAEQRQFAEMAQNSGQTLLTLINDILDLSKIEAGKLDLEILEFELRPMIEDALELLSIRAAEKRIELVCDLDAALPGSVRGDPTRLRQILLNLGGNAIKFTPAGGDVLFAVRIESRASDSLTLRFTVRDSGIGIPVEQQSLLFSPFSQSDASTTRKFGGTGLGLAISKQLAEKMQGGIGLKSEAGKGATFWFTAVLGAVLPAAPGTPPPAALEGLRVLVADDHPESRRVLAGMLAALGCRAAESADGAAAWERVREAANAGDPFRVLLVDKSVADSTDFNLLERLQSDAELDGLRRVQLVFFGQGVTPEQLGRLGVHGQLHKPCRLAQLRECLLRQAAGDGDSAAAGDGGRSGLVLPGKSMPGLKVLLAEDNVTNQIVATKLLERMGCVVRIVPNGREALEVMARESFGLVLMDCQMPLMDGFEATRRFRTLEARRGRPRLPIVACTASVMGSDRHDCLKAGMDAVISKPLSLEELAGALQRWGVMTPDAAAPVQVGTTEGTGTSDSIPCPQPVTFDREEFLNRLSGDTELAETVIRGFLADLPQSLAAIRSAVEAGDVERVGQLAHRLRGSAATLSGQRLRDITAEMGVAAKSADPAALRLLVERLDAEAKSLAAALGTVCSSRPG